MEFEKSYKNHGLAGMKKQLLLLHFRIATSGLIDAGNTHPFPISSNPKELRRTFLFSDYALVHNGILKIKPEKEYFSDTMQFVISMARKRRDPVKCFILEKNRIDGGCMALMDGWGRVELLGDWIDINDVLFSNDLWQMQNFYANFDMEMMEQEYYEQYPNGDRPDFDEFVEEWLEAYEAYYNEWEVGKMKIYQ